MKSKCWFDCEIIEHARILSARARARARGPLVGVRGLRPFRKRKVKSPPWRVPLFVFVVRVLKRSRTQSTASCTFKVCTFYVEPLAKSVRIVLAIQSHPVFGPGHQLIKKRSDLKIWRQALRF